MRPQKKGQKMYEFIILAQLMYGPSHGYLIAKIINDMIGPYARLSYGRLYPLLAKLEQNELIAPESGTSGGQRDRKLRIYSITNAGRTRFQVLMRDTSSSPGEYQKLFTFKACYFGFITPPERLRLIDHYINYCQAHVLHLQKEAEDLLIETAKVNDLMRESPELARGFPQLDYYSVECIMNTMQHFIDQWHLELNWARQMREREVALATKTNAGTPEPIDSKLL
jgi:DNA-binding PadR family transcriptional regulator